MDGRSTAADNNLTRRLLADGLHHRNWAIDAGADLDPLVIQLKVVHRFVLSPGRTYL